jgi:hypothetical protein
VVEVGQRRVIGRQVAAPGDVRAERNAGHRDAAVGAFFQHPFRAVLIAVDDEPGAPREVEQEQHMAARQRGDQSFIGIDPGLVAIGLGHDVRAGLGRHHRAAVESPFMRAAVAPGREHVVGPALPADGGGVCAHINPARMLCVAIFLEFRDPHP